MSSVLQCFRRESASRIFRGGALIAGALVVATACGDADGTVELPFDLTEMEWETDTEVGTRPTDTGGEPEIEPPDSEANGGCESVPWGNSCKTGNHIYNLTFQGVEATTEDEMEMSFEAFGCMGYRSALIVAGDVNCTACPAWYDAVGARIDDIHKANGVLIAISTAGLGVREITHVQALDATDDMHPDYATGSDPFTFPCRYGFTPFSMVVDLQTAEILGQDSSVRKLSMNDILELVRAADRSAE